MGSAYNPLDKKNLGISVRNALLDRPVHGFPPVEKFDGAGIYALYYVGSFPSYEPIAEPNRAEKFACPIYVGKAVPAGSRKGGLLKGTKPSDSLYRRLREHANSIAATQNLGVTDFYYRYLEVDDIWIPLGETYMIESFQPVWNKVVEGFGIKTPGKRRKEQWTSLWDTLHPGRKFVTRLGLPPNPKTAAQIERDVRQFLALPPEEKAMLPVREGLEEEAE